MDTDWLAPATVILAPQEAGNKQGQVPETWRGPSYWQFTFLGGFLRAGAGAHTTLRLHALYPRMEGFSPQIRERWFEKNRRGEWGVTKTDVLRIMLSYETSRDNDRGKRSAERLADLVAQGEYIRVPPPANFKATDLQELRPASVDGRTLARSEFLFRDDMGYAVVVYACSELTEPRGFCSAATSWHGKIQLEYYVPISRLPEMGALDKAIKKLIDSSQPAFKN